MTERFNVDRTQRSIGSQPNFHDMPTIDALTGMVIALLGEVVVLRDRVDAAERLSAAAGGPGPAEVDRFAATPEVNLARQAVRNAVYDRVLGVAVDKLLPESLRRQQSAYETVLQDVEKQERT